MKNLYKLRSDLTRFCNLQLGMRLTRRTPDRLWLHKWLQSNTKGKRVLSIGVSWYTMLLPELAGGQWVTVDYSKDQAPYGATSHRHYTADFAGRYLSLPYDLRNESQFDAVIMNGVFGVFGMQTPHQANEAILNARQCLNKGGVLLIGFNDLDGVCDFDPRQLSALDGFSYVREHLADPGAKSMHTYLVYKAA